MGAQTRGTLGRHFEEEQTRGRGDLICVGSPGNNESGWLPDDTLPHRDNICRDACYGLRQFGGGDQEANYSLCLT